MRLARCSRLSVRTVASIVAVSGMTLTAVPAMHLADGDDARLGRVGLAADELLHAEDRLARRHDRVVAQVRIRAVTAVADEGRDEIVGRREQRAALGGDGADGQARPAVQAEDGRRPSARVGRRARRRPPARSAPPPPSSAGCQISFTQTGSSLRDRLQDRRRRPRSVAMCPSCPQACIRPSCVGNSPARSARRSAARRCPRAARRTAWTGRRSARSSPSRASFTPAVYGMPSASSSARIGGGGLELLEASSGIRCSRCRNSVTAGRRWAIRLSVLMEVDGIRGVVGGPDAVDAVGAG